MPDSQPPTPSPALPRFADVEAAARTIDGAVMRTPFTRSRTLSEITGADIWVKFENLQFTASFKERGALTKLSALDAAQRTAGVIAMSAGNHAQGVAYHAGRLGIPTTIVMPEGTPFVKVSQTAAFGARVVTHGTTLAEAGAFARTLGEQQGLTFVHPYDDAAIVAGQGTATLEMLTDRPDLEAMVVPVGGGGLIAGAGLVAEALAPRMELYGVEVSTYASMRAAWKGEVRTAGGTTVAEGIAVAAPGEIPLAIVRRTLTDLLLVDETQIEHAISLFAMVEKTVAEGAGAAGLAAVLAHRERFTGKRVGLILCGGNIDARLLSSILMRELVRESRVVALRIEIPDRPGVLAQVAGLIGGEAANILEVQHNRLSPALSARSADLEVMIETRDAVHTARVVTALEGAGFRLQTVAAGHKTQG